MTQHNLNTAPDDVRMRGFKKRSTVEQSLAWLDQQTVPLYDQNVPLQQAGGRILATDIISHFDIPGFDRSMMDGYALLASHTQGASPYNQLPLKIIGQAMPGRAAEVAVTSGTAVRIMTGAPIPDGADAVLPAENVETLTAQILVTESVAEGRNIGRRGEDVTRGSTILKQGRRLRPQDIGLLASIGMANVPVKNRPGIRIITTGSELLPVGSPPQGHQIVSSNGPMLEALCRRDGATHLGTHIVPDDADAIRSALRQDCDILLVSGGTSVGEEDLLPLLLAEAGELAIHGVAMRPSRSAGMGTLGQRLIFLIPGNPVACLCAYDFFAGRLIRRLCGYGNDWPYKAVQRRLSSKLVSMIGRTDYARVQVHGECAEPIAVSGAARLSSTTQADGFVIIPADHEGYATGTDISVYLYDPFLNH